MKRPDVFSAIYALSSCCLNEGTVRAREGGPSPAESIRSVEEAKAQLDATTRFWRNWLAQARIPDHELRPRIAEGAG